MGRFHFLVIVRVEFNQARPFKKKEEKANQANTEEAKTVNQLQFQSESVSRIDQSQLINNLGTAIKDQLSSGKAIVIAVVGGEASGKTTLTNQLVDYLKKQGIATDQISTDNYVIGDRAFRRKNLDGGDSRTKHDFDKLKQDVQAIQDLGPGETIRLPSYDEPSGLALSAPKQDWQKTVSRVDALIVEGVFYEIQADLLIFLWLDEDIRLKKRIDRDQKQRNETSAESITENFISRQEEQYFPYTLQALEKADLVVLGDEKQEPRSFKVVSGKPIVRKP